MCVFMCVHVYVNTGRSKVQKCNRTGPSEMNTETQLQQSITYNPIPRSDII